jgi:hypothetical protein
MLRGKDKGPYDSFYQSSLAQFLSCPQNYQLIRYFRAIQEDHYQQQQQQHQFADAVVDGGKTFITGFIGPVVVEKRRGSAATARSLIAPDWTFICISVTIPVAPSSSPGKSFWSTTLNRWPQLRRPVWMRQCRCAPPPVTTTSTCNEPRC